MKILIVGAGPTGLTAAIELARHGIIATVIDRRDSASTLSRAVGITPTSLQLLSHSGVAEKLIAQGIAMSHVQIYRGDTLALTLPLHSHRTYFPTILGLPQDKTEAIMLDAFAALGGTVRYGVELNALDEKEECVVAKLSNTPDETYEVVIGADGVDSTVRTQSNIAYPGIDLHNKWSIADIDAEKWIHPAQLTLVLAAPGKVVIVAPIGSTRYRVVASSENALQTLPLPMNVTKIHREGTFNISIRQAPTYSKGRIHLAGDAAHCHSPVGGRGMNLGIADAVDLVKHIAVGDTEQYSPIRHEATRKVIETTERVRKLVEGQNWGRQKVVRMLLASMQVTGPLKRRFGRFFVEF